MRTALLCFLFFLLGVFSSCFVAKAVMFWRAPVEVAVVSAPIQVHLFVETAPGTAMYMDRKIWNLKTGH